MLAAPLLIVCLLAPPDAGPAGGPPDDQPTGAELERRAVAELDAALDAPLAEPFIARPGETLAEILPRILPDQIVRPDTPRLDLEGLHLRDLPVEQAIEFPAGRFPARVVFQEAFDQVGDVPLTLINDGGILKITTRDYADERLLTRVYNVRDLLEAAGPACAAPPWPTIYGGSMGGCFGGGVLGNGGLGSGQEDGAGHFSLPTVANQFGIAQPTGPLPPAEEPDTPLEIAVAAQQPLIDVIQYVTGGVDQGGGWEEVDGIGGTINVFNGVLTIRQTEAVHRQIAALLEELRTAFDARPWSFPVDPAHARDHAAHDHEHADSAPYKRGHDAEGDE